MHLSDSYPKMRLPAKDSVNIFLLHHHISYLMARKTIKTYDLQNYHIYLGRGYTLPDGDTMFQNAIVSSPDTMRNIVASHPDNNVYIPHILEPGYFFGQFSIEIFNRFYFVDEGSMSYKPMGKAWCHHGYWPRHKDKFTGCFGACDGCFPSFHDNDKVIFGNSTFDCFQYDLQGSGLLIVSSHRAEFTEQYRSSFQKFLQTYTESSPLPLLVSARYTRHDSKESINFSLEMLNQSGIHYQIVPGNVVKECLIYHSEMPVYYYHSSLGLYAEKMGKKVICYRQE